jgi:SAM-dependent methyltransferase
LTALLPFTGERFTPETRGAIWYEHWHRYAVMHAVARGKRVLDAACGEGYGSALLADSAAEVTGIDVDAAAIGHAVERYAGRRNLRFVRASCAALPVATGSIDLIVSFETIEHLAAQEAMLAEFRRVLARPGVLVISSPNKAIYSAETGYANEFHVRELSREELAAMLCRHFPQQAWYGQRVLAQSLLWRDAPVAARGAELIALDDDRVLVPEVPAPPMYFVVACAAADAALPRIADFSVFDDGAQSLYRDYQRALLAEKRLYYEEIDARKIAQARLADLVAAAKDLADTRQRALDREAELVRAHQARAVTLAQLGSDLEQMQTRLAYRESWRGWLRWPLARARLRLGKRQQR